MTNMKSSLVAPKRTLEFHIKEAKCILERLQDDQSKDNLKLF